MQRDNKNAMKKKNALLIIDPQYDFCDPVGALYVKGADRDMEMLSGSPFENERISMSPVRCSMRRVVMASSSSVYGANPTLPKREDLATQPLSPYAVSKVAQDMLGLQYFLSRKLRCVRVRPFNHIGPRQRRGAEPRQQTTGNVVEVFWRR